ncbi:uncharacterized protein LOC120123981 [Hibiscus syriacus]|uniref:uncharacterized protein LOC120123981 n=1 Tax=Hibiscus syriacus TaxID=106335 RepID=UPI001924F447|nr:uncharacterized protein LOC120123981 [Hibiscus syriacus]
MSAPKTGSLKLNTDGACLGIWMLGFTAHLGICTGVAAELHAIRIGLSITWEHGYRTIECEMNARVVLQLIEHGDGTLHPLGVIIEDIQTSVLITDILSKMGCPLDEGPVIFEYPPSEVSTFLDADYRGVSFLRGLTVS